MSDVMGLRFRPDGDVEAITTTDLDDIVRDLDDDVSTARVPVGSDHRELLMFHENHRHASTAVNANATQLRANGFPVVGEAVLVDVEQRPLPDHLVERYFGREPEPDLVPAREWEHRLDDLDQADTDLAWDVEDLDVDDLMPAVAIDQDLVHDVESPGLGL